MKDIDKASPEKNALILIGSNIDPISNVRKALGLLSRQLVITRISKIWETAAIGSDSQNFLNLAIIVQTGLSCDELKNKILRSVESRLGRIRTSDKNAARTMDLDVILYRASVVDKDLWKKAFIALPVSDLVPDLLNPLTGESLVASAKRLQKDTFAVVRNDLNSALNGLKVKRLGAS